ncbi:PLP-dependent aminotransferase family protein [Pseudoalteromonas denitrificans]|uniref:DNA-binding transcriptional regulator, MocR family, contains an aminotransferase domain n=1 Tax=Pseudoalteromonas denitrificans DSM 6059 TaxID=1123010 RepID=A0A1I1LEH9_9GAMM|nr:PLP-dependent aminotransferase family protein [Pseudoalteromonas denitrificans]SFC71557.1 DNA-binding transcriptional regulator, MocR family, contains an aminotransferase domain [Pseudoalteromonas denitrificans DSM 6059]
MTAKYIALSHIVISKIEQKQLMLGQRMPAIRRFSAIHEVSITTALNCYQNLQALGWLQAKPQSGYFVTQPFGKQAKPQFPQFKTKITSPKSFGQISGAINSPFYISLIAPELIPFDAINRCIRIGNTRNQHQLHLYPEYQGQQNLRKTLAQHFSSQYFPIDMNKLIITNGCIDAVKTAIQVTTKPGDAIAISSPCFNGLIELLENLDRKVIEIPCYDSQLDLAQLKQHIKDEEISACLFSSNHINPQGICFSAKQKQQLAELAAQYKIPIIEDDIYLELSHNNANPLPIKHWDKAGWVLWCSSFSKTVSPSYRLGWCEPGRYFEQYLNDRSVQNFGINLIVQNTFCEFIYSGQYLKHLKKLKLKLNQNVRDYHKLLIAHLPKQARISTPNGGLVLWVQIPNLNSKKLLKLAIKENIYFRAGFEFSTLDLYQDCFRINIGWSINDNNDVNNTEAVNRYEQLIKLCGLIKKQIGFN